MLLQIAVKLTQIILLGSIQHALTAQCSPLQQQDPAGKPIGRVVDLGYAKYQGTVLEAGVNQYLGMRYAAPPTGDLRWRAPRDPPLARGVQDASRVRLFPLNAIFFLSLGSVSNKHCSFKLLALDSSDQVSVTPRRKTACI